MNLHGVNNDVSGMCVYDMIHLVSFSGDIQLEYILRNQVHLYQC